MEAAFKSRKLSLADEYTLKRTSKGYETVIDPALLQFGWKTDGLEEP